MVVKIAFAWALGLYLASSLGAQTFHVANDGNDGNTGSEAQPFATLQRARDEIRKRPTRQPASVVVHGGTYIFSATLDLGPEDSGIWHAAEGEEVRLSGGPALAGRAFAPVQDAQALARINPA